jgi:ABC-type hemin transport system ATPase subunit
MTAIEACDVSFRRCGRTLVQRVSLSADRGELLALCGPTHAGTATVLSLLAGELTPDAGRVLVDGITCRDDGFEYRRPDPRLFAHGPEAAWDVLARPALRPILLLDEPIAGLPSDEASALLGECRRRARQGACVVLTTASPDLAAGCADTVALFVAGRLLSWGEPAVALVPALRLLSAGARARGERDFSRPGLRLLPDARR